MPKPIAVAVLNWNGRALLQAYLRKLVEDSKDLGKVYVIDNASTDDSIEWMRQNTPEVNIIELKSNYGYAGGYNKGLAQIKEEFVVLINSDIESTPGWLQALMERFEADEKLAALQPKILDLKNRSKFEYAGAAGGYMDYLGYAFCRGRLFEDIETDKLQYQNFQECFWATGACLMVRKSAYEEVGGLYATLFAHMEEIDLCWKLQINGWKVAIEPASSVYHLGGATLETASPRKTYLNFRNNLIILFLNLPSFEAMRIIFSRLVLDGIAGLRFLSQGKLRFLFAILQAHFSFYGMFNELYRERIKRKQKSLKTVKGVYKRSLIIEYFVGRKKRFSDLDPKDFV